MRRFGVLAVMTIIVASCTPAQAADAPRPEAYALPHSDALVVSVSFPEKSDIKQVIFLRGSGNAAASVRAPALDSIAEGKRTTTVRDASAPKDQPSMYTMSLVDSAGRAVGGPVYAYYNPAAIREIPAESTSPAPQRTRLAWSLTSVQTKQIERILIVRWDEAGRPRVRASNLAPGARVYTDATGGEGGPSTYSVYAILKPEATRQAAPAQKAELTKLDALADRICKGDPTAVEEFDRQLDVMYEDVNPTINDPRIRQNYTVISDALGRIEAEVRKGNTEAYDLLIQLLDRRGHAASHIARTLGNLAAAGNEDALQILLDHDAHGILESTVVSAMGPAAEKGNRKAIQFLADIINGPNARALGHMASQGLTGPAQRGDPVAKAALQKFQQQQRSQQAPR